MIRRTVQLLLISNLSVGVAWADDTFVGEWKLDPSHSQMVDQMKVEKVDAAKYAFNFGGGAETITLDGTDQPGVSGTTLSVSTEAPDAWKVVRKREGRVLLIARWKLSGDGGTLTDDYTEFGTGSTSTNIKYVYHRTAGTSGFAGTWESSSQTLNSAYVLKIRPYGEEGLSLVYPQGLVRNLQFDGKDYPAPDPNAAAGATSSARRVDRHTLEVTGKAGDKVTDTREIKLSPDGATLIITVRVPDRSLPNVFVFARQ